MGRPGPKRPFGLEFPVKPDESEPPGTPSHACGRSCGASASFKTRSAAPGRLPGGTDYFVPLRLASVSSPRRLGWHDSTHRHKDFGCPGCTSRLHHHSECPGGQLTRKEAAAALIALGRMSANAAALTAAGTNVTEFEAAVGTIYN